MANWRAELADKRVSASLRMHRKTHGAGSISVSGVDPRDGMGGMEDKGGYADDSYMSDAGTIGELKA